MAITITMSNPVIDLPVWNILDKGIKKVVSKTFIRQFQFDYLICHQKFLVF